MRVPVVMTVAVALVAITVSVAPAGEPPESPLGREWFEVFREDWENGGQGWILEDMTGRPSEFHVSEHYAYDDGTEPNYSYWCGTFEYDADGGYGNGWHMLLELPEIDLAGATQPRLSFRYRHHSIPAAAGDVTRVEVKYLGEYRALAEYLGFSAGWQEQPALDVQPCDNPLKVRFRLKSNEWQSDEDGSNTDGGAFHCDEIRVFDWVTGTDYFYDDVEDGVGLCTAVDVPATGIVPRLIELPCRAYSDPTCVCINAPGDTTSVPPNVFVRLTTPPIHLEGTTSARVFYAGAHCGDGDLTDTRMIQASFDDGETWILAARNDYAEEEVDGCNQFSPNGLAGYTVNMFLPAHSMRLRITVYTDDDGIGPGVCGAGGSFLDDVWVVAWNWTAVSEEEISWGRIKGLYR